MSGVSRRVFLKSSSAAVVAARAISASWLPAMVGRVETQGPADVGASGVGRYGRRIVWTDERTARRPYP